MASPALTTLVESTAKSLHQDNGTVCFQLFPPQLYSKVKKSLQVQIQGRSQAAHTHLRWYNCSLLQLVAGHREEGDS